MGGGSMMDKDEIQVRGLEGGSVDIAKLRRTVGKSKYVEAGGAVRISWRMQMSRWSEFSVRTPRQSFSQRHFWDGTPGPKVTGRLLSLPSPPANADYNSRHDDDVLNRNAALETSFISQFRLFSLISLCRLGTFWMGFPV